MNDNTPNANSIPDPEASKKSPRYSRPVDRGRKGLTNRQKMFIHEYLKDFNGIRAATAAGYSKKTAKTIADENLTKPIINEEIQRIMNIRAKKLGISTDRILQEVAKVAFAKITDFVRWNGKVLEIIPSDEIDPDFAAAISSISIRNNAHGPQIQIKLHNKNEAIQMLMKHLGLLIERHELTGANGGPIEFSEVKDELFTKLIEMPSEQRESEEVHSYSSDEKSLPAPIHEGSDPLEPVIDDKARQENESLADDSGLSLHDVMKIK